MRNAKFYALTILATLLIVIGCERKPTPRPVFEDKAVQPEKTDEAVQVLSEDIDEVELVAKVNGEGITRDEFRVLYQHTLAQNPKNLNSKEKFNIRINLLSSLIMTRLLKQKALEADLPVDATMVEVAFNQVRENFHFDDDALQKKLAADGYTIEQFKKTLENEIRVSKFEDTIKSTFDPKYSEADLKDWYEEHQDAYRTAELRKIAHILIALPEKPTSAAVEKAQKTAIWIRDQIVNKGADFGDMAEKYSDDKETRTSEGVLGNILRGQSVATFDEAAFSLNIGDISQPVRSYNGFHLIKLLNIRPTRALSFQESLDKGLLEKDYLVNRKNMMFRDWLGNLRKEATVEILDPEIVEAPY